MMKCPYCEELLPLTAEFYYRNKNSVNGFNSMCKVCKKKYDREMWYKKKKEKAAEERKAKLEKEQSRIADQAYEKLMQEPKNYGVGNMLNTLNFSKGKRYLVIQSKDKLRTGFDEVFEGELVYNNQEHITLKHNLGYRESFRKFDILCGEIKIKEV